MNIRTKAAAAVLAAAIIATAAPAYADSAGDPPPPLPHCEFTFKSLKAINLWDDGDSDFVYFQTDGRNWPGGGKSIKFFLNSVHTAAAFDYPTASANIIVRSFGLNVVVDEPWPRPNVDVPPQPQQLLCGVGPSGTNQTRQFSNGDAQYELTYDLTLPHL
ncbi:hypothetical protein Rhe02_35870 [Rhizocola hellebori]|uniref:Secreted protein n=1 Tax=Rhizocola hellebori TaxID=1392758 RepID=A0A8J3Q7Z1_9ACTN|nr:hypothetical protein [Rhizocola hellebori]GIH05520.1 hypothetical protein Rhe02_35870 [Rhizocola hellebori]